MYRYAQKAYAACPEKGEMPAKTVFINDCLSLEFSVWSEYYNEFDQQAKQCEARNASEGGADVGDNDGGGDDDDDGGDGNVREVAQDTDLYDAREGDSIGMLEGGSSVTTAGACGDEWCELSNPKGWVWGGDLN
jgi:hypothetical protein